jgi:hypothetical protein
MVNRAWIRPLTWFHRTVPLTRVSEVQRTRVSRIPMRLPSPVNLKVPPRRPQPFTPSPYGVNIVARRANTLGLVFYWAFNGSGTWTPSDLAGAEVGPQPAMVAYPGNPGGVHVVDTAGILGGVAEETNVNGSGTWQETDVCDDILFHSGGCQAGSQTVTMNGGLVNIAVFDENGNLDFWWQDSSGTWHQETVDTAANL